MRKLNVEFISLMILLMISIYLFVRVSTGSISQSLFAMSCFFIGALFGYTDRINDEKMEDKKDAKS